MSASSTSILLVDDDEPLAVTTSQLLSLLGHRVTWKATRSDATEALSAPNDYEVVLLDLCLGEDRGEEVVEDARRRGIALPPVVILSAQPDDDLAAAAKATCAKGVLRKPCTSRGMQMAIEQALQSF